MAENIERIPKVIFVPEDTEVVSVTTIRKINYTPEELEELKNLEEPIDDKTYTQVHTACFGTEGVDGFDALTGNTFSLNENDEWELIEDTTEEIEGKSDEILVELTALVLGTLSRINEDKGLTFTCEYLSDLYRVAFESIIGISIEEYTYLKNAENTLDN